MSTNEQIVALQKMSLQKAFAHLLSELQVREWGLWDYNQLFMLMYNCRTCYQDFRFAKPPESVSLAKRSLSEADNKLSDFMCARCFTESMRLDVRVITRFL